MHTYYRIFCTCLMLCSLPSLEGRVWISELVADNDGSFRDEDGDREDWIELFNDGESSVDLSAWGLTDDLLNRKKWVFPNGVTLGPGEFLVVYASGKDRRLSGAPLHTNFSLGRMGEYLGLVRPDGTVEHDYAGDYPVQVQGGSYGLPQTGGDESMLISAGAAGQAGVPVDQADFMTNYQGWNSQAGNLNGPSWQAVQTGVGYERTDGYGALLGVGGDLESVMFGENTSVFLRLPFSLSDPAEVQLILRMRWDDGFVAYVNGVEVARNRAPATLTWNSEATDQREDGANDDYVNFPLDLTGVSLQAGDNVLAIHGLNFGLTSSDMLILPELEGNVPAMVSGSPGYFSSPTPGVANGESLASLSPVIVEVTDQVERPTGGAGSEPLKITARVQPGTEALTEVVLLSRVMFRGEAAPVLMKDDGTGGDEMSGDGVFTAMLPTTELAAGEMLRWRVEATDANGGVGKAPAFAVPMDADRYFGTVARDPAHASSRLPIIETFMPQAAEDRVDTRGGGRISLYYLGRFYDNVQMDLHGQSTASFNKKSYDLDFNAGNRFLWKEGERKVKDVNLLTNWADKSKVRNTLAYEYLKQAGAGYHFAFPVRMDRNGEFFSITDLVEDGDDRYLDRIGLDEDGALYKMYDRMEDPSTAVKKTRKQDNTDDLQALIDGLKVTLNRDERRRFAYDNVDIPATVNHLAANLAGGLSDTGHKNYYLYRDTEGTGEWRPLPWDVDLSFGRQWTIGPEYFDDVLYTDFWVWWNANPLWELIHNSTEFRLMVLRRFHSLRGNLIQENGTPNDWLTAFVTDLGHRLDPLDVGTSDAARDYAAWGSWGNNFTSRQAIERLLTEYLPARRTWLFSPDRRLTGVFVPEAQPSLPNVTIETVEYLPASGNQDEEYLVLKNRENTAIDLSGWTLSGGIEHTFPAGTILGNGDGSAVADYVGNLYVTMDARAFRERVSGPKGGEFRLVQGGYKGQLSARGETIELRRDDGQLIDTFSYSGAPTPAQSTLRITRLNYHPSPPTNAELSQLPTLTAEDFEFIELANIGGLTLDLGGVSFQEGIEYLFPGGTSLAGGARLILAKNPAAFQLRYPTNQLVVLGPYLGRLNNDGEKLKLVDAVGENVLNFEYNDRWYPSADGEGDLLAVRDVNADYQLYDAPLFWGASADGVTITSHYNAWQEATFQNSATWSTTGLAEADPDNDQLPNWQEYAFGTDPLVSDKPLFQSELITEGGQTYLGARVRRRINAADLTWILQESDTMESWASAQAVSETVSVGSDGSEVATLRLTQPVSTGKKFARLQVARVE